MIIEGTYTLQAPPEKIWHYLTDQEIVKHTFPGIEHVHHPDQNTYELTLSIQQGPFKGTHHTHIVLSEQQYPYHYRLTIESDGRKSFHGVGSVHLQKQDQTTIIAYKGTLHTNKLSSFLTPKLVKGAAKHFIQQYFLTLAEELYQHTQPDQKNTAGDITVHQQASGNIVILPTAEHKIDDIRNMDEQAPSKTMLGRLIRLLHVGGKDPQQQLMWEKRIRRASTISGLLFLIWLGTRIPRRFS